MHPRERIAYRTAALKQAGLWREPADGRGAAVGIETRSNDYLGLVSRSVSRETGFHTPQMLGAGASRVVSGSWAPHEVLEAAVADWLGTESSLLFSSGYAANLGAVSSLVGPGETIISDSLNHASIIDGCRLSRAKTIIIPHGGLEALERALADTPGVRWVIVESYYGMDGDSPDLRRVRAICDAAEAGLIVDEAHALGVFGTEGRGLCEERGIVPDVLVGGLGKAFGAQGGFVATSSLFRDWLWNRARSFVYSTGSSPLLSELVLERLQLIRGADAERAHLRHLERRLQGALQEAGVPLPAHRHGPIFPVVFGEEADVLAAARATASVGVACQPIRPPTVPAGGSRLRIILNAGMTEGDVDAIAGAVQSAWTGRLRERSGAALAAPDADGSWAAGATRSESRTQDVLGSSAPGRGVGAREKLAGAAEPRAPGVGGRVPLPLGGELDGHSARGAARVGQGGGGRPGGEGGGASRLIEPSSGPPRSGAELEQRSRRWVVLGVGTGVGKTYVARTLVQSMASRGLAVAGLKPIETGVAGPGDPSTDAAALQRSSLHVKHPDPHPLYAFRDPVTPALAARREHVTIDMARIRAWLAESSPTHPAAPLHTVLETAGGVFSPVADGLTNLDLANAAEAATWLLVAADRLGVLHDVSATLAAMRARAAVPDYLILSAPAQPDDSTGTNAAELRRLPGMPPIIELPRDGTEPLAAVLGPIQR